MLNTYPWWKNLLLAAIVCIGCVYALPNFYSDTPAIQILGDSDTKVDDATLAKVQSAVQAANLPYRSAEFQRNSLLVRYADTDTQLKAKDVIQTALGDHYSVAPNLAPSTPAWLRFLGASPMKLGLDLRGGINLLLDVDVDGALKQRLEGMQRNLTTELREENIRYLDISLQKNHVMAIQFRDQAALDQAKNLIRRRFPELQLTSTLAADGTVVLLAQVSETGLNTIHQATLDQTLTILSNRVNELGIAEVEVQQQGTHRIAVNMPGIQDTARAMDVLGRTATLEFHLADTEHDVRSAVGNAPPPGTALYDYEGRPVLLKTPIILSGNSITYASEGVDQSGRPKVDVTLGGSGGGESLFHRITGQNVGKPMAIVYVEVKTDTKTVDGKPVKVHRKSERVISLATIQSALPGTFQISGLKNTEEARDLALLLRAGALPAATDVVEERVLGPQLGVENIKKGILSVLAGMGIVIIFMAIYYQVFGLIANLALIINLILLVAVLSVLGMTLTLPGIAGVVLTVAMAVDANILIFERIREELRAGVSPQTSIHAGYSRAFSTILDANITTLIVALVLFGIGVGSVKGFAVTLTLGLLTSMLSSVAITRAFVNWIYGGRHTRRLLIGI